MTTAQSWTPLGVIGTTAAGILAMVGLSFQSLRGHMDARLDDLDRDVQTLFRDRY